MRFHNKNCQTLNYPQTQAQVTSLTHRVTELSLVDPRSFFSPDTRRLSGEYKPAPATMLQVTGQVSSTTIMTRVPITPAPVARVNSSRDPATRGRSGFSFSHLISLHTSRNRRRQTSKTSKQFNSNSVFVATGNMSGGRWCWNCAQILVIPGSSDTNVLCSPVKQTS